MAVEKKVKDCFGFIAGSLVKGRECGACKSVDRCIEATCLNKMVLMCARGAALVKEDCDKWEREAGNEKTREATRIEPVDNGRDCWGKQKVERMKKR